MLGYIGITFGVVYPPLYYTVLNALSSVIQIDLPRAMPLGCMIHVGFFRSLVLRTLPPLVVIALLALAARVLNRSKPVAAATCSSLSFFVLFLVYPSASSATFTAFICDELEDGVSMMRVE